MLFIELNDNKNATGSFYELPMHDLSQPRPSISVRMGSCHTSSLLIASGACGDKKRRDAME